MRTIGYKFTYRSVNIEARKETASYEVPILYEFNAVDHLGIRNQIDELQMHDSLTSSHTVQCDAETFWASVTRVLNEFNFRPSYSFTAREGVRLFNRYNDVWDEVV